MKHTRMTAALFTLGFIAWLAGVLPALGAELSFTERLISDTAANA